MDAFPDQNFTGEVIKVSTLPDQQRNWLSPDIKVYTTQVRIDGTHSFLKPGMSARVEVFVDYAPDALTVPVQVVANRGGKKVCYVVSSGKSAEREVKTGLFNDTYVQILEGLNEGDEVVLNPPRITEPKTEPDKQLAGKFPKPAQPFDKAQGRQDSQKNQPMVARSDDDPPAQVSEPNRSGRRRQGMPMGMMGQGGPPMGMPDFNQLSDEDKERIKQFREKVARGEITFDPNQMTEEQREKFRQFRNRARQQSDGQSSSQEP